MRGHWLIHGVLAALLFSQAGQILQAKVPASPASLMSSKSLSSSTPGDKVLNAESCTATFTATGSMGSARSRFTATLLQDGRVLAAGGASSSSGPTADAQLYNPEPGDWGPAGAMTTPRSGHSATLLPNGKVLVAGGSSGGGVDLASAELFDPASGTWTATGDMTTVRSGHSATLLPNGEVLVEGGQDGAGVPLASAEVYNPATGAWSLTGSMAAERQNHKALLLSTGKVLVAGGCDTSSGTLLASAELYDPVAGTWSSTGSMATPRMQNTISLLPGGKVLVAGGGDCDSQNAMGGAELYDPATGAWSGAGSMATARLEHRADVLLSGKVLVVGGEDSTGSALASAELYDPATGAWTATASMVAARSRCSSTHMPGGKVLMAGGFEKGSPNVYLASAELYDETPCCPAITISPAGGAHGLSLGMAYDVQFEASGGTPPYTFSYRGALPPGTNLSTAGLFSGTPTAVGSFAGTAIATDANSCAGSQDYYLTVVTPPVITLIKKASSPFRLVVTGSNLQNGIQVGIGTDTTAWPSVTWKNTGKIIIGGGSALKAKVPKGTPTTFNFGNPDGGVATVTGWSW